MRRTSFFVVIYFLMAFTLSNIRHITIYMIGDSTMSNKPQEDNPERGWGMMFQQYFDSTVSIVNHAVNGCSTRTFISENRWQNVYEKIQPDDYVIIQFGHNDENPEKKDRYASPADYKINLIKFINETRSKNAIPILCTPIVRRRFDNDGKFYDTHGVYPDIVRQLADSMKVPILDMHRKSEKLIIDAGVEGSKKFFLWIKLGEYKSLPKGREDNTHFSEYGATKMAQLAVEGLRELNIELTSMLKK
jgi:DNA sulfur modification protein DndE